MDLSCVKYLCLSQFEFSHFIYVIGGILLISLKKIIWVTHIISAKIGSIIPN